MKEERKGVIALAILRQMKIAEGIRLNPANMKRGLGNLSKEINIPLEELTEFAREETQRLVDECFRE